jgi:hypothetical protein
MHRLFAVVVVAAACLLGTAAHVGAQTSLPAPTPLGGFVPTQFATPGNGTSSTVGSGATGSSSTSFGTASTTTTTALSSSSFTSNLGSPTTPARTGLSALQLTALALGVMLAGFAVVRGIPKPGRHAKGYARPSLWRQLLG